MSLFINLIPLFGAVGAVLILGEPLEPFHVVAGILIIVGIGCETNQVSDLLSGLDQQGFGDVAVEELLLRAYKPIPERLRPDEEMVGHTGFLVFARCMPLGIEMERWQSKE